MKTELVLNLPPSPGNPRNSEGAFLRGNNAEGNNLCTLGISRIDLSTVEE